ncbi:phage/plasmid primase, P4 family [Pollutibacter soli]|uniref:DNA primase family protein n=1 Tax=Pollutibacter soli TaxID=3034157 RepID=UPI0030140323
MITIEKSNASTVLPLPIAHEQILSKLLVQLKKIEFRQLAGLEGQDKLQRKHFIVYAIEEILKSAKEQGWQLCRNNGQTYLYNGEYWKIIDRELLQDFFGRAAEMLGVPQADARFYTFRLDLLKQFEAVSYLPPPERVNGKTLVNCKNGTFEVEGYEQKLREHRAEDFLTHQLPFEYNSAANSPLFHIFLDKVLPGREEQMILQEYLGYVFVDAKKLKLEKVLLLYGGGANGKSVFIEVLSALLGPDNVSRFSLESITDPKGYSRAELSNKLLNLSTEISGRLDKGIFKQLASGESVEARFIYGSPFTMENYARLLFSTNELPKETENSNGFFRRWQIVPFDVTIPEHEQDKELSKKIIDAELSGVFNWVLDGLNRLLKNKRFTESKAVKQQVESFRLQSDSVLMFLDDEGYQKSPNDTIEFKRLFELYRVYCNESGYYACSKRTFSERLRNAGFHTHKMNYGNIVYAKKSS